jgi:short subunit dehydrogenase-like uncharacterized protein
MAESRLASRALRPPGPRPLTATPLLLYGATGYSGRLILVEALKRGHHPVVAGRSSAAVRALAAEHRLEPRVASLEDPEALAGMLAGIKVVLHCAGPFAQTARPMVDACIAAGVHYLDITGEVAVFEAIAARDAEAKAAGVTLLPGVGFDVVPSDCLAAHLRERLPDATSLVLAFAMGSRPSRGTRRTMMQNAGTGTLVRRGGRLERRPPGWDVRTIPFDDAERTCVSITWGDLATAYRSTGIGDITVYAAASPRAIRALRASRWIAPLLRTRLAQRWLARRAGQGAPGPSDEARARSQSRFYGEVRAPDGRVARARLIAPDGYTLTALTAVRAAERVLARGAPAGFVTPSRAFGEHFILDIPFTSREDLR